MTRVLFFITYSKNFTHFQLWNYILLGMCYVKNEIRNYKKNMLKFCNSLYM